MFIERVKAMLLQMTMGYVCSTLHNEMRLKLKQLWYNTWCLARGAFTENYQRSILRICELMECEISEQDGWL